MLHSFRVSLSRAVEFPSGALKVLSCLVFLSLGIHFSQALYAQKIVISQVYGAGGNGGTPAALLKNDFVELFNRGNSAVTMTSWSVQYASASGTGNFGSNAVTVFTATLQPGQYF